MRKGITPIISIIVLLLITIALAGLAYTYLSGYVSGAVDKSFTIPPGGAYCTKDASINQITVFINNKGPSTMTQADFQEVSVRYKDSSGNLQTIDAKPAAFSLDSGGTKELLNNYDCTSSCGTNNEITIGTAAGFQTMTVLC